MFKLSAILVFLLMVLNTSLYAEDAKKEEPKKEEPKKEEPKKVELKKIESKQQGASSTTKECFYQVESLGLVENHKFEYEVKKIEDIFEKCEQSLIKLKEQDKKDKECKLQGAELKEKKKNVHKPLAEANKINKKEDFDKLVAAIKVKKEEYAIFEKKYNENCHLEHKSLAKVEPKKEEPKKEEPKKEEPKKEEPKKEEPKKEEPKKEEPKKEEPKKEEPKKK